MKTQTPEQKLDAMINLYLKYRLEQITFNNKLKDNLNTTQTHLNKAKTSLNREDEQNTLKSLISGQETLILAQETYDKITDKFIELAGVDMMNNIDQISE